MKDRFFDFGRTLNRVAAATPRCNLLQDLLASQRP